MNKIANFDDWCGALFAAHPGAKIIQERLNGGGFAKVAFLGRRVVGKFTFTDARRDGWVA